MTTEQALDARARRAAHRAGYVALKSRWRSRELPPRGFMLIDLHTRFCVAGSYFNLSAEEVIEWCRDEPADEWRDFPPEAA
jgi:hypothetical protein